MAGATFVPAGEHTSVEINVQQLDETIVVTPGKPYTTNDPGEIDALDENPTLERKSSKSGAPKPRAADVAQPGPHEPKEEEAS